jgi:hypothetical protein
MNLIGVDLKGSRAQRLQGKKPYDVSHYSDNAAVLGAGC